MIVARVLHIASHRINVGDGALNRSIQAAITEAAGGSVAFDECDVVELHDSDAPRLVDSFDQYDLVLVGGGGAIDGSASHRLSGMAAPISASHVRNSETPIAFLALGHNLFPGERFHGREALSAVVEACRQRDFVFSVRNDGSLARLERDLGQVEGVLEVPDPGFFVETSGSHVTAAWSGRRPLVIVQLAGDNVDRRLGARSARAGRKAVKRFVEEVRAVLGRLGEIEAEIVVVPHIIRDLELISAVVGGLGKSPLRRRIWVHSVAPPNRSAEFFRIYAEADLAIAMRGHSVICAVGLGTPCIALSTHEKVAGFMTSCGLSRWSVDPREAFVDQVIEEAVELLGTPAVQGDIRRQVTSGFSAQFEDVIARATRAFGRTSG